MSTLLLKWNSPRTTLSDVDLWLSNYFSDTYDGLVLEGDNLWVNTVSGITAEQENYVNSWFYTINNQPREIIVNGPKDTDGSSIVKTKTTRTGWHYEPRSIDFISAKVGSKYNRKHNTGLIDTGTSYGDASLRFFDESLVEIVSGFHGVSGFSETADEYQLRVTENCAVTYLDWQPTYEMDIIGGMLQILEPPPERAYMWAIVAPDIPEVYGGNVPFLAGGFNLQYFKSGDLFSFNGRGVKSIAPDFVYNSNKFRIIVKHAVGRQIGIQVYFEHFKA